MLNNIEPIIEIKIKKLTGFVSLLTVLVNNLNKINRIKAIPKGNTGRKIEKFMELSILKLHITYKFILREKMILIKKFLSLI